MVVNFKLFKLYTRIYYNFILGKINNSTPKLNINISGIKLENKLLIIFPLDEESFRVAAYSFRKLIDYNNSDKYTLLINEDFKNLFYFNSTQIIYGKFNKKKQSLVYNEKYLNRDNFDLVRDSDLLVSPRRSKFITFQNKKLANYFERYPIRS